MITPLFIQYTSDGPLYILRGHTITGYNFQKNIVSISLKISFVLANSADPDEMPHDAAFHLGLHCLPNYPFMEGLTDLMI